MSIIIKSNLNGEISSYDKTTTGPKNLLRVCKSMVPHVASMTSSVGNVGHRGSWVEIDGVQLSGIEREFITNMQTARDAIEQTTSIKTRLTEHFDETPVTIESHRHTVYGAHLWEAEFEGGESRFALEGETGEIIGHYESLDDALDDWGTIEGDK